MAETKQQIMNEISSIAGIPVSRNSTGSSTPREFFVTLAELLGITGTANLDKPNLARAIVEAAGLLWLPENESRGSTVTRAGVLRVRDAVRLLLDPRMSRHSNSKAYAVATFPLLSTRQGIL